MIKKILNDCFTGKDNRTFDWARILWALGGFAFVLYAGWETFKTSHFAAQDYGIGFGGIMGGGGASLAFKARTEPDAKDTSEESRAS